MTQPRQFRDASGTVTSGGTAQVALAANEARTFLQIHNPRSESESLLYSFFGAAASGNAFELAPGGTATYETDTCPNNAVSVLAATTGHKYVIAWC